MDFFILLVLNVFIGAIIFLILSLKIEKTSSTFQEKKLRKEMSEIITEFNATAERNITLLENRISVLKKLLIENGSLKGVDFTISDDKMNDNRRRGGILPPAKIEIPENQFHISKDGIKIKDMFKDDFHVDNEIDLINNDTNRRKSLDKFIIEDEISGEQFEIVKNSELSKENRIDLFSDDEIILNDNDQPDNSMNIEELFQKTDDKYALIASLFAEGHSVEELSKYSGIPSGEIKLVISLIT